MLQLWLSLIPIGQFICIDLIIAIAKNLLYHFQVETDTFQIVKDTT